MKKIISSIPWIMLVLIQISIAQSFPLSYDKEDGCISYVHTSKNIEDFENLNFVKNEDLDCYKKLKDIGIIRIYIVNLKRSDKRRKSIGNLFRNQDLPITFLEAYEGLLIKKEIESNVPSSYNFAKRSNINLWKNYWYNSIRAKNGWPEFGAWQSHLSIYFDFLDRNEDGPVLIIEDDSTFMEDFSRNLKIVMDRALQMKWDMLFLGYCSEIIERIDDMFSKLKRAVCAHGYILSGFEAVEKLIKIQNTSLVQPPDVNWIKYFQNGQIDAIIVHPEMIFQDYSFGSLCPTSAKIEKYVEKAKKNDSKKSTNEST